jgi:hypothetical protein
MTVAVVASALLEMPLRVGGGGMNGYCGPGMDACPQDRSSGPVFSDRWLSPSRCCMEGPPFVLPVSLQEVGMADRGAIGTKDLVKGIVARWCSSCRSRLAVDLKVISDLAGPLASGRCPLCRRTLADGRPACAGVRASWRPCDLRRCSKRLTSRRDSCRSTSLIPARRSGVIRFHEPTEREEP